MKPSSLLLLVALGAAEPALLLNACSSNDTASSGGAASTTTGGAGGADGGDDAPPAWLKDAGLVVRDPVKRPLHAICGIASNPGDMPLGQDAASANLRKGYFDAALDLGGVMIRRDFRFDEIEPQKGTFDFARHDALLDEADARGVRILGSMLYGTLWSNPEAKDHFWPPDPDDFAEYAAKTAERYTGRLVGWEVWNEPNGGFRFWKPTLSGDPVAYGTLLAKASDAVHGADPGARVLLGGTVFTPQLIEGAMQWLREAYAARPDLADSFDVAGIHTYMAYPPRVPPEAFDDNDPPLEAKIQMHAWLLAQHGADDKEMWITEIGWPSRADVPSPSTSALRCAAGGMPICESTGDGAPPRGAGPGAESPASRGDAVRRAIAAGAQGASPKQAVWSRVRRDALRGFADSDERAVRRDARAPVGGVLAARDAVAREATARFAAHRTGLVVRHARVVALASSTGVVRALVAVVAVAARRLGRGLAHGPLAHSRAPVGRLARAGHGERHVLAPQRRTGVLGAVVPVVAVFRTRALAGGGRARVGQDGSRAARAASARARPGGARGGSLLVHDRDSAAPERDDRAREQACADSPLPEHVVIPLPADRGVLLQGAFARCSEGTTIERLAGVRRPS